MKRRDLLRAGAMAPFVTALPAVAARDPAITDMTWLTGKWQGEGSFMGRPSTASLYAKFELDRRFLEIEWWVGGPTPRPLYRGRGFYRPGKPDWNGQWFDSTGAIRPLTAVQTDFAFRVSWGAPETEQGTSLYALDAGKLTVEDSVNAKEGPRVFAKHVLKRVQ